MIDLSTTYLGLNLKSPIIAGSCGMTNSIEHLVEIENAGGGAVVLKSIFEEQIVREATKNIKDQHLDFMYAEAVDYINNYTEIHIIESYVQFIRDAKKAISIPIIASVNCTTSGEWVKYAKKMQDAGADALELNVFILPIDSKLNSDQYENQYFEIIDKVKKLVTIPVSVKTSLYFSAFAKMMEKMSWSGVDGIVMFNRFYSPDIDIDNMKVSVTDIYSKGGDYALPLRWIAILFDKFKADLCASTGIHSGETVVKMLLAGANAVQVASALHKSGIPVIGEMNGFLADWMDKHHYSSIDEFRGEMSYKNIEDPSAYQRIQFMKYFAGI